MDEYGQHTYIYQFRLFLKEESGATAIEYALIASIISIAIISTVASIGNSVGGMLTSAANAVR